MSYYTRLIGLGLGIALITPTLVLAQGTDASAQAPQPQKGFSDSVVTGVPYNGKCASAAIIAHENKMQSISDRVQSEIKKVAMSRRDAVAQAFLKTEKIDREETIKKVQQDSGKAEQAIYQKAQSDTNDQMATLQKSMRVCGFNIPDPKPNPQNAQQNQPQNQAPAQTTAVKKPEPVLLQKPMATINKYTK